MRKGCDKNDCACDYDCCDLTRCSEWRKVAQSRETEVIHPLKHDS